MLVAGISGINNWYIGLTDLGNSLNEWIPPTSLSHKLWSLLIRKRRRLEMDTQWTGHNRGGLEHEKAKH